jgi:hypothetical protein
MIGVAPAFDPNPGETVQIDHVTAAAARALTSRFVTAISTRLPHGWEPSADDAAWQHFLTCQGYKPHPVMEWTWYMPL